MRMEALACRSYDCKLGKAAMARLGGQSVEKKLTAQRWEIIKKKKTRTQPRKRSRKQENKNLTKKAIKKIRKQELDQESNQEKGKKNLFFLITFFVELFLFSFINSHLRRQAVPDIKDIGLIVECFLTVEFTGLLNKKVLQEWGLTRQHSANWPSYSTDWGRNL